jgi:hypothetical protein
MVLVYTSPVTGMRKMATNTRSNAWNNGGTFDNTDLLWYAKGVGAACKGFE